MIYNLEAATFTVLGNFITSCYTKNWLWQDLLRRPLYFKGELQKGAFLVFALPAWLPYNDCILLTGENGIESKLKDLFLPAQVQKQNEKQQTLILNVERLQAALSPMASFELVYWPGYRFVVEPMTYRKDVSPAVYMLHAFDYILRVTGSSVEVDAARQSLTTSAFTLGVSGENTLDSIELIDSDGRSYWNLAEKVIRLEGTRFKMFRGALERMLASGSSLENCSTAVDAESAELRYVGELLLPPNDAMFPRLQGFD